MRRFVKFVFVGIFFLHIVLLHYGIASVISSLVFYAAAAFTFPSIIKKKPVKLFFLVLICSLFGGELLLRYAFKSHLTYAEANAGFFYFSPYKQIRAETLKRRFLYRHENLHVYVHKPHAIRTQNTPEFNYIHTYDKHGLRNPGAFGDTSDYLIIGLGDSFTEGVGVPDDSTWCILLENILNSDGCLQKRFGVLNAGVYGSDPFYDYKRLAYLLEYYKPSLVILTINTSDIADVMMRGGMERFKDNGGIAYKKAPFWENFYAFSFIVRAMAHNVFGIQNTLMTVRAEKEAEAVATKAMSKLITSDFYALSHQHGFELLVVFQPMLLDLEQSINRFQNLKEQLSQEQINMLDIHEFLSVEVQNSGRQFSDYFWPLDRHPNSKACLFTASVLKMGMKRYVPEVDSDMNED